MYLLFGPSSQDLLSEILFVIIAQIICCIWHMLHLALTLLALCCTVGIINPVGIMLHLALLALCCVGTVGIKIHLELLALYCIWH